MALKGTLADLGIVDLIQFPHAGRKSGELIVTSQNQTARLYYDAGALVHVVLGSAVGMDALVSVVDWKEGTFEFDGSDPPSERSITTDLHRTIMQAVKLHDEKKEAAEKRKNIRASGSGDNMDSITSKLEEFIATNSFALHVCVLDPEGDLVAVADGPDGIPRDIEELHAAMHDFIRCYPREGLTRILLLETENTIIIVRLADGSCLIALARKDASLGAVSVSVGRLAASLE